VTESFTSANNFRKLAKAVKKLGLKQPIFVKMPNEIDLVHSNELVKIAINAGIYGFIFSNLVKDRKNPVFDKDEIQKFANFKGNFSGAPTFNNSNRLIKQTRKKFGKNIAIIGLGGIFTPKDALSKLDAGADLVQLITGMIFQGPQLIGEICKEAVKTYYIHL
jgi:dihydroorotate dehydrogenase